MSIFKKAAPEPPAKVEPKGSAYDLDIEADGDDPATAATVVNALYAKYKKNVRVPDETHARAARIQRARADLGHGDVPNDYDALFRRSSRPGLPASPRPPTPLARSLLPGPRDDARSTRRDRLETQAGARGDRSRRRGLDRPMSPSKSMVPFPFTFFTDGRFRKQNV